MNNLQSIKKLKNIYFAMRHGKSLANEQQIILSNPIEGIRGYGLSDTGKQQIRENAMRAWQEKLLDSATIIISSDFMRTRETAEIVKEVLGANEIILTPKLRERFFGTLDKTHHNNYEIVWLDDIKSIGHKNNDVESMEDVLTRTTELIKELEEKYTGENILLVSHGDPIRILQTAFERIPFAHRSEVPHLQTAEIKKFILK